MRTAEKFRTQHYEQNPRAMDAYAGQFGVDAATLDRHLQVMSEVADGELSAKSKQWLHERAAQAGIDRATAARMIQQVLSQPHPEARAAAYINSAGQGGVAPEVAQQAMALHRQYSRLQASLMTEDRLVQRDKNLEKAGLTFDFEDREQFQRDRQEAAEGVRGAIEKAMVSSGIAAPPARTLDEVQARAQLYADRVADRLQSRPQDRPLSLREEIEDSYLSADALNRKIDAGLTAETETPTGIGERLDRESAYWQSLTEAPSNE